jgi:hypothetical protein
MQGAFGQVVHHKEIHRCICKFCTLSLRATRGQTTAYDQDDNGLNLSCTNHPHENEGYHVYGLNSIRKSSSKSYQEGVGHSVTLFSGSQCQQETKESASQTFPDPYM